MVAVDGTGVFVAVREGVRVGNGVRVGTGVGVLDGVRVAVRVKVGAGPWLDWLVLVKKNGRRVEVGVGDRVLVNEAAIVNV